MNKRAAQLLAICLVITFISLTTGGIILQRLAGIQFSNMSLPVLAGALLIAGSWSVIGALIVYRHPRHPVGWLLYLAIIDSGLDMFATGYIAYDIYVSAGTLPGTNIILLWITGGGSFPVTTMVFAQIMMIFPEGQLPSKKWRLVSWFALAAMVSYFVLGILRPGQLDPSSGIYLENPYGVSNQIWSFLEPMRLISLVILIGYYVLSVFVLAGHMRRSKGEKRQQIKWLVPPSVIYGLTLPLLAIAVTIENQLLLGLAIAISLPAIMGIIIAVAFAIFKFRLYQIDTIVNRTMVYGLLTAVLAGIYFGSVIFLQQGFRFLTDEESPLVVVFSTLLIAVLFSPIRRRLQVLIDQRFYRRKYDMAKILAGFAESARNEVDLDALVADLQLVVDRTLQPRSLSLWLKKD